MNNTGGRAIAVRRTFNQKALRMFVLQAILTEPVRFFILQPGKWAGVTAYIGTTLVALALWVLSYAVLRGVLWFIS